MSRQFRAIQLVSVFNTKQQKKKSNKKYFTSLHFHEFFFLRNTLIFKIFSWWKFPPHSSCSSHARYNRFKRLFLTEFQQLLNTNVESFSLTIRKIESEKALRERNERAYHCVSEQKMNEKFDGSLIFRVTTQQLTQTWNCIVREQESPFRSFATRNIHFMAKTCSVLFLDT